MHILCLLICCSNSIDSYATDDGWHQFRGNHYLTGVSPLKCAIANPEIRWKQFIGVRETLFMAKFADEGNSDLVLPNDDLNKESFEKIYSQWNAGLPLYDPDNNGK